MRPEGMNVDSSISYSSRGIAATRSEAISPGITANAALPGLIASERVAAMPRELFERLESTFMPSGRIGEMDEVASLVAYLASEDAGYVTGQEIGVDGGAWLNTFSLTRRQRD